MSKNFNPIIWLWILLGVTAISVLVWSLLSFNQANNNGQPTNPNNPTNEQPQPNEPNPTDDIPEESVLWGIDTASTITEEFLGCVVENYGTPAAVGRYLATTEGVSAGITTEEVQRLHNNGIKIIPIHNKLDEATGYEQGQQEAEEAIGYAKDLKTPEGVYLFVDIEPGMPVDADFLIGWTETIQNSKYKAGAYGNFDTDGEVRTAYKNAVEQSDVVKDNLAIWSNNPVLGVSSEAHAPNEFKPATPNMGQTYIWQYGLGGKKCNIDTDLVKNDIFDSLW